MKCGLPILNFFTSNTTDSQLLRGDIHTIRQKKKERKSAFSYCENNILIFEKTFFFNDIFLLLDLSKMETNNKKSNLRA